MARDIQDQDRLAQEDQPEPDIHREHQPEPDSHLELDLLEPAILPEDQPAQDSPLEDPWPMLDPAVDVQRVAVHSTHSQDIIIKTQKALALLTR